MKRFGLRDLRRTAGIVALLSLHSSAGLRHLRDPWPVPVRWARGSAIGGMAAITAGGAAYTVANRATHGTINEATFNANRAQATNAKATEGGTSSSTPAIAETIATASTTGAIPGTISGTITATRRRDLGSLSPYG